LFAILIVSVWGAFAMLSVAICGTAACDDDPSAVLPWRVTRTPPRSLGGRVAAGWGLGHWRLSRAD
jgi:hypothetical protein